MRLVECLMGIPPRIDCLKYICDHLLVSDLNDVKYVAAPSALETSVSAFEGQSVINSLASPPLLSPPLFPSPPLSSPPLPSLPY